MKILQVVHYFLPRHRAGTEIYTYELSKALARENSVMVFTSEDSASPGGKIETRDDEYDGIPVQRLFHAGPEDFRSSYENPEYDRIFGKTLDRFKPDIVHFQHLYRLSTGFIREARKRRIPAALTLADYWFLCPPIIMLKPGFELCPGPERGLACAACGNAIEKFYAGDIKPFMLGIGGVQDKILSAAHSVKRRLPRSWVRSLRKMSGAENSEKSREELLTARFESMRSALAELDLIISPSEFLRNKMIEGGLANPEKIIRSDYGFPPLAQDSPRVETDGAFRFAFVGTLVEHKGVHVAVKAMNLLHGLNAGLSIHGDERTFPGYVRDLRRMARNKNITFAGGFEHKDIGRILAGTDALIVPSLWYENSPLTIHEAFQARVPVIASNLGGMAELVKHDVSGLLFKCGDPADLAAAMKRLIEEPGLKARLSKGAPAVKSMDGNLAELTGIYNNLAST